MSNQAASVKSIEERQKDLDKNVREASLRSINYAARLLQTFADIKPDDNKYAAIKNIDYFINKFGAELAQYDKGKLDNIIDIYKKLITAEASDLPNFNECTDDQKLAVFMAMRAMGIESNKEDYMKLINDNPNFSPFLKAVGFYSLLDGGELENWSLNDLEQIGISDWPERAKYELVEKLARDNLNHDNLTDISDSVSLANNKFFKDASPEVKRLLIFTLFGNVNKGKYLINASSSWASPIITIANESLDDDNKCELMRDIEDKFWVNIELEGEKGKLTYRGYSDLDGYKEPATIKLERLVNGWDYVRLADMDELAYKLKLDGSHVKDDLCVAFFKRIQKEDPSILTPGLILKRDWPAQLKKIAYNCLPAYYKTEANLKAIFELDQINLLIDKAAREGFFGGSKNTIKDSISNYISMLKPHFALNDDNQKKIKKLEAELDQATQIDDFRNLLKNGRLYEVIEEATVNQFDDFLSKLGELMDTEEKADQLSKYLSDPLNGGLPSFIAESKDPALISFVENNKNIVDEMYRRDRDFKENSLLRGAQSGAYAGMFTLVGLAFAKVPVFLAVGVGAAAEFFSVVLSLAAFAAGGAIIGVLIGAAVYGIYKLATRNRGKGIKKIKNKTEQIKKTLREERKKNPEFDKKLSEIENKVETTVKQVQENTIVKVDRAIPDKLCKLVKIKQRNDKLIRKNALKADMANPLEENKTPKTEQQKENIVVIKKKKPTRADVSDLLAENKVTKNIIKGTQIVDNSKIPDIANPLEENKTPKTEQQKESIVVIKKKKPTRADIADLLEENKATQNVIKKAQIVGNSNPDSKPSKFDTGDLISNEGRTNNKSKSELKSGNKAIDKSNIKDSKVHPLSRANTIGGKKGKNISNRSSVGGKGNINRSKTLSER